ncbi:Uncharacterised protein [Mycobacteroides abscessus subsp. abscessus]|nr:Uncharacterised protein [Mycobacteroides abscessus subsp. abscessus]
MSSAKLTSRSPTSAPSGTNRMASGAVAVIDDAASSSTVRSASAAP